MIANASITYTANRGEKIAAKWEKEEKQANKKKININL